MQQTKRVSEVSNETKRKHIIRYPVRTDSNIQVSSQELSYLGEGGMEAIMENHVALLTDPRLFHPANAIQRARMVNQLQRTHGNQAVQRLIRSQKIHQSSVAERRSLSPIANMNEMAVQLLESGRVGDVHYDEDPRDIVAIRMPYRIDNLATILTNVDRVIQNVFGSSGRTYTGDIGFQGALRSFLESIGHPSVAGGGPVMRRERWLRFRVRLIRGEGNRIDGLELLRPVREVEVETPERVEAEVRRPEEPSPEQSLRYPIDPNAWEGIALEPAARPLLPTGTWAPLRGHIVTRIYRMVPQLRTGTENVVYYIAFNPRASRNEYAVGPNNLDSFLSRDLLYMTAAGNVFGIARELRPYEVTSHQVGYLWMHGHYRAAIDALGESWLQALQDPHWWMLAVPATAAGAAAGRGAAGGAEVEVAGARAGAEAEAGAARALPGGAVRPTAPTEPAVRPTAPTEPAVRPTAPTEPAVRPTAPTEPAVRPTAPTEPAVRPTAPTEPAGRPAAPGEPARPSSAPAAGGPARGRLRVEREYRTEEVARQIRDEYVSGEAAGGWDAAFSEESLLAHWRGVEGRGEPPLAFVDTRGHLVFDARRLEVAPERLLAEGVRRRFARRPPQPPSTRGLWQEAAPAAPPSIQAEILNADFARDLIRCWRQAGDPVLLRNTTQLRRLWQNAGMRGDPPIGWVNSEGGLIVNREVLAGH